MMRLAELFLARRDEFEATFGSGSAWLDAAWTVTMLTLGIALAFLAAAIWEQS